MTHLRFGIRDLLWAMVVVGLAVGWWQAAQYSSDLTNEVERAGAEVGHATDGNPVIIWATPQPPAA